MRSVIEREVFILQLHRTTDTLGLFFTRLFSLVSRIKKMDGGTYNRIPIVIDLSCQFKMHSTKNSILFFMDFHASSNFGNDVYKMSSFEGRVMDRGFGAKKKKSLVAKICVSRKKVLLLTCHAWHHTARPLDDRSSTRHQCALARIDRLWRHRIAR